MTIKIKAEKSYYVTEVSIETPVDAEAVSKLLQGLKTNGKMVVVYSGGGVQDIVSSRGCRSWLLSMTTFANFLKLGTKELSAASRKLNLFCLT